MSNTPCESLQTGTGSTLAPGKWQSLPLELVNEIVSNLDTWSALNFANSCREFSEPGNKVAWRHVDLTFSEKRCRRACRIPWYATYALAAGTAKLWDILRSSLDADPERKKHIQSISYHLTAETLSIAKKILPQLSNLQHIKDCNVAKLYPRVNNCITEQDSALASLTLLQVCGRMPNIVSLDVSMAEGSPKDLFVALHNFPSLVNLRMGLERGANANIPLDVPTMPHLESLCFTVANWPELTLQLISNSPKLHDLAFDRIQREWLVDSPALNTIFQSEQIRSLEIEQHKWDFHHGFVRFPADCLPNLEKITWSANVRDSLLLLIIWCSYIAWL